MKIKLAKDANVHKITQLLAVTDAGQFPVNAATVGDNLVIPVDGSASAVLTDAELAIDTVA